MVWDMRSGSILKEKSVKSKELTFLTSLGTLTFNRGPCLMIFLASIWLLTWFTLLKQNHLSPEVSKDGRYITTADGSSVKFWDANHFGLVKSYDMPCKVESTSLEPKFGDKFIAGGEDMWIRLFDFNTSEEISCSKGHHGSVHCVRFSPGGESYASGSEDGTIRIWLESSLCVSLIKTFHFSMD